MNFLLIGFGSIGQGITPLLKQRFERCHIHIITACEAEERAAQEQGVTSFLVKALTSDNYQLVLEPYRHKFDFLINVSVDVSSIALIEWCQIHDKLYIDTCVEPWSGGYRGAVVEETTNYFLRTQARKIKAHKTAVIAHGANPGLVTYFVKAALDNLAQFFQLDNLKGEDYAHLNHKLAVKVIQVAERDSQETDIEYDRNTFINTWSVDGFISEAQQRAEIGSSEALHLTQNKAYHCSFGDVGKYLQSASYKTKVKSWVPSVGQQEAYLITHHEATSISQMLEYKGERPTVYYAYKPCPATLKSWPLLDNISKIENKHIIRDEIVRGEDELGVLLISEHFSYWFGSILSRHAVQVPYNSATTQQVTISMLAAIEWAVLYPSEGITEAEDIPHSFVLNIAAPYLGEYGGVFTDFTIDSLDFNSFLVDI